MPGVPAFSPEKNRAYIKGSPERAQLEAAIADLKKTFPVKLGHLADADADNNLIEIRNPAEHATAVVTFKSSNKDNAQAVVDRAVGAKEDWASLSSYHRSAVLLRASNLIAARYRPKLTAALILGQGKDARQAEVDVADLMDYLRLDAVLAENLYSQQPEHHAPGILNTLSYHPLEGFVFAATASESFSRAANTVASAILTGNVVIWAPSNPLVLASSILLNIFKEAGLPQHILQLLPGSDDETLEAIATSSDLGALAFSGALSSYLKLQSLITRELAAARYKYFPRLLAETAGFNYHVIHPTCDLPKAVSNTIRGAFEYQGQKSDSISSVYVPSALWDTFETQIKAQTEVLSVGTTTAWKNFVGPVVNAEIFKAAKNLIAQAQQDDDLELVSGGGYDDSVGFFVHPTIFVTRNIQHPSLKQATVGPILIICVYDSNQDEAWPSILKHIKTTLPSSKSGSVFASDRKDINKAVSVLESSLGNLAINTKSNLPQVGQSPYGGGRFGGTGEKHGTRGFLERFVSVCSVKEELIGGYTVIYASHVE